jgi:hypothetical protein
MTKEPDLAPGTSPTAEARFRAAPLYRDAKGYVWQRLRNGLWRSTDGCWDSTPRWAEQPANERWAPYTRIDVIDPQTLGDTR